MGLTKLQEGSLVFLAALIVMYVVMKQLPMFQSVNMFGPIIGFVMANPGIVLPILAFIAFLFWLDHRVRGGRSAPRR